MFHNFDLDCTLQRDMFSLGSRSHLAVLSNPAGKLEHVEKLGYENYLVCLLPVIILDLSSGDPRRIRSRGCLRPTGQCFQKDIH